MDADEAIGVEELLELRQRLLLQQLPAPDLQGDVIVLRFEVVDLRDRDDVNIRLVANEDALERRARRPRLRDQRLGRSHLVRRDP